VFTWGTHLLATHPEAQTRLREEIRANIPSLAAAKEPSFDLAGMLETLPYLSAVCSELLRLYPSVPTTIRVAVRDTSILGTFVPKGTKIWLSPWGINHSPHLWGENAQQFYPERWIDPETGKANNNGGVSSNYANMTFLHGPRSCIGERFAKAEFKALIAAFVGTFQIAMADPNEVPVVAGAITTKPRDGMRLRLKVLDGWGA
jgi:cytochrome P450